MKRHLLHILFLLRAIPLVIAQQTCPSSETPTDMLGPFYVAETPMTTTIGPQDLLQDPSNRLDVSGRVLSAQDCTKGLSGVTIEVWYAGSEGGYRDDEYRGMFVTDECGKYNYTQTFPFLYTGRPLHVHIRASRGTEELLVTQMYFVGQEFGFQPSRTLQAVEIAEAEDKSRSVQFDIFLDVEGDANENCSLSSSPVDSPPVASPVVDGEEDSTPVVASAPQQPASNAETPPVVAPIAVFSDESIPSNTSIGLEPTVTSLASKASSFATLICLTGRILSTVSI